jgi:DNA ligase-1
MLNNTHNERDTVNKIFDSIYKRDTKGKLRFWYMEQEGSKHRTYSGLMNDAGTQGTIVMTDWTQCGGTNIGRSNERTPEQQATFEIEAQYEKKLSREYHKTKEDALAKGAHFFKPMLANKYEQFAAGYVQPKLDGVRCIATIDGLFSRQGKEIPGAPHIIETLAPLFAANPDLILDGELYNHELKDDFNEIISLVKKANPSPERLAEIRAKVQYHIYDIPSATGGFCERHAALCALFTKGVPQGIHLVETLRVDEAERYDELHGRWLAEGFEGSIWRCLKTEYQQKRSKSLLKRKEFQDDEFKVIRIEEGLGNWSGMAKRVVCALPDGREFGAGIKGSMARAKELLHEDHNIVTVQFFAYTPDGIPRFPVATKFHGSARTL